MIIKFISDTSNFEIVSNEINEFTNQTSLQGIIMLIADGHNFNDDQLNSFCVQEKPIFGGIFPQVVYNSVNYDKGILIIGLKEKPNIYLIEDLSNPETNLEKHHDFGLVEDGYKTMFVFVDGFATRIGNFIESLFNIYGIELNFIGGGAGSLSMIQKPSIITNKGILMDAAVMASIKSSSGIGVKHGWEVLAGPFKVSNSEGNKILTLENKSAFEIYKEVIENDCQENFDENNFFETAKAYPFGISKIGTEKIVRDPIMKLDDGSLVCVGEVPQNSFVHILKGKAGNLIKASESALFDARANLESTTDSGQIFLVDCISRVLFLEEDFNLELESIGGGNSNVSGVLTLGEIANSGKDYLEFYNKTAVVAIIENL